MLVKVEERKNEEITEEELMEQDPLEVVETIIKEEEDENNDEWSTSTVIQRLNNPAEL